MSPLTRLREQFPAVFRGLARPVASLALRARSTTATIVRALRALGYDRAGAPRPWLRPEGAPRPWQVQLFNLIGVDIIHLADWREWVPA